MWSFLSFATWESGACELHLVSFCHSPAQDTVFSTLDLLTGSLLVCTWQRASPTTVWQMDAMPNMPRCLLLQIRQNTLSSLYCPVILVLAWMCSHFPAWALPLLTWISTYFLPTLTPETFIESDRTVKSFKAYACLQYAEILFPNIKSPLINRKKNVGNVWNNAFTVMIWIWFCGWTPFMVIQLFKIITI